MKNLNTQQLNFTAVHSNNKNLNTRQFYSFLGHFRALNFIHLDARQSGVTAVHRNDGNLKTLQLQFSRTLLCTYFYLP